MPVASIRQSAGRITRDSGGRSFCSRCLHLYRAAPHWIRSNSIPPLLLRRALLPINSYARIIKNLRSSFASAFGGGKISLSLAMLPALLLSQAQKTPAGKSPRASFGSYAIGEKGDVLARRMRRDGAKSYNAGIFFPLNEQAPKSRSTFNPSPGKRDVYTRVLTLFMPGNGYAAAQFWQTTHGKVLFAGEHLAGLAGLHEERW